MRTTDGITELDSRRAIPLRGVLPVLATPFDAAGGIDPVSLAHEVDWLIENGADGVTLGMVSELDRLSESERIDLAHLVCASVAGRGAVVVSATAESTVSAVRLARAAVVAGADAVMVAPPLLTDVGVGELRRHVGVLVDSISVPLVLQDPSGYLGRPMAPELQGALVVEHGPDTLYLKPESAPIGECLDRVLIASDGLARFFDGSGGATLGETHARGAVGTMPGPDLVWAVRRAWDLLDAGETAGALRITSVLAGMLAMAPGLGGYIALEKHNLLRQGVLPDRAARAPLGSVLGETSSRLVDLHVELLGELTRPGSDGSWSQVPTTVTAGLPEERPTETLR